MSAAKKKRRIGRSIGFVLLTILLVGLTTAAICGMVFAVYINKYVSNDVEIYLDSYRLNLTSFMYYVDPETGKEVELNSLHGLEDRVWVDLEDIPKQLQLAFISVEDNTFYTHNGVNWKRTIIADHSHTDFDKVWADSDRDYWMTAQEAKEYGMIDKVYTTEKHAANEKGE